MRADREPRRSPDAGPHRSGVLSCAIDLASKPASASPRPAPCTGTLVHAGRTQCGTGGIQSGWGLPRPERRLPNRHRSGLEGSRSRSREPDRIRWIHAGLCRSAQLVIESTFEDQSRFVGRIRLRAPGVSRSQRHSQKPLRAWRRATLSSGVSGLAGAVRHVAGSRSRATRCRDGRRRLQAGNRAVGSSR